MKVISVNVGRPQTLHWKGKSTRTAIVKKPVMFPLAIRGVNLEGDQQANLEVHGGPNKSVYAYPSEHYAWWKEQMPFLWYPWGAFGENLTTEGLLDDTVCVGDHIRFGSAILAVTQPRMPCFKLQARFQNEQVLHTFVEGGRHGFYFAVIEEGQVGPDDSIEFVKREPNGISIEDVIAIYYRRNTDRELEQRVLALAALPPLFREKLAQRIAS